MKRGMTLVELLVIIVILAILFILTGSLIGGCNGVMPNYSEGERTGELFKVSHKGLMWRSWEIEMKLSDFGLRSGNDSWVNVIEMSTRDDEVGKQLEELIGQRVVVKYHQYWAKPWKQDSAYTVISVKPVGASVEAPN